MRILNITTHPDLERLDNHKILHRNATRGIILKGEEILLYTLSVIKIIHYLVVD